jgi:DNA processing protein
MTEADYYLGFSLSPSIGPKRFQTLRAHFKTAENAWTGTQSEFHALGIGQNTWEKFESFRNVFDFNNHSSIRAMQEKSIQFISQSDSLYPTSLLALDDPPIGLYVLGEMSALLSEKSVAVVGSRTVSEYGADVTKYLASGLASRGITIISGLALGVDAIAHSATLTKHGTTIAVLGNGVDIAYPRENSLLYKNILHSKGCIISEYPPGMMPTKGSFPARNRIVAALSHAVLVTEARANSGALITAEIGRKLNKIIFAVPGPINMQQSVGALALLKSGAQIATAPEDILATFADVAHAVLDRSVNLSGLSGDSLRVMEVLIQDATTMDVLSKKCTMPIPQLSQILTILELEGYVKKNDSGKYVAV